jgi:hypothetical protein
MMTRFIPLHSIASVYNLEVHSSSRREDKGSVIQDKWYWGLLRHPKFVVGQETDQTHLSLQQTEPHS